MPYYWSAGPNTNNVTAFDREGRAQSFGDKNLVTSGSVPDYFINSGQHSNQIGAEIDFQDFDFGLTDWEWDLGCPMSMSYEPSCS
jgi:hypothetical protein